MIGAFVKGHFIKIILVTFTIGGLWALLRADVASLKSAEEKRAAEMEKLREEFRLDIADLKTFKAVQIGENFYIRETINRIDKRTDKMDDNIEIIKQHMVGPWKPSQTR